MARFPIPPRLPGWYPAISAGRVVCLHWTGGVWELPLGVHTRRNLPGGIVAHDLPVLWPENDPLGKAYTILRREIASRAVAGETTQHPEIDEAFSRWLMLTGPVRTNRIG